MKSPFLFLLFAMVCTSGTKKTETSISKNSWADSTVAYEIFIQSFADSNNDGIGDIPGMTARLDYLKELGINAIWLMPIMPSPSYHKYDVTDYKGIHPDYGTMEDFKEFVEKAHEKEIKIIVDLIINHTSDKHPWFIDASSTLDSKYRDYYVWADRDSIVSELSKRETSFDSDNIQQWHSVDGETTSEHYYGFFYGGMPDLNYDNPMVRQEVYDIGKFWLEDVGIDGFRMDAAKHIYPDDRATDNHAFWVEFKSEMEKIKHDVYIVGEVWSNTKTQTPYVNGFSALFDFDLAFSILKSVKSGRSLSASISGNGWDVDSVTSLVTKIIDKKSVFAAENENYSNAIFLSNHDQNRVMSVLGNDVAKAKLAASIMLTLPGMPYIYYGEEIGMKGTKPDPNIREPFLWDAEVNDKERASWIQPMFTKDSTVTPLAIQTKNAKSIYNHYKNFIDLRKKYKTLTIGSIEIYDFDNSSVISFTRTTSNLKLLVIHNLSEVNQQLKFPAFESIIYGSSRWVVKDNLMIPQNQTMILEVK